jgi:hypothetical protein
MNLEFNLDGLKSIYSEAWLRCEPTIIFEARSHYSDWA